MKPSSVLILLLSAGNFAIGMGAFVVIGILGPIASDLGISAGQAGALLTWYAIAYAIGSPLCVALTGAWSRRNVLLCGLGLFALGALLSAIATHEALFLMARVVAALGAGLFTPVAAGVALASAAPEQQGQMLSRVFFGLTLAQVVGVPAGSWLGYSFGWQTAFVVVLLLTLIVIIGVVRLAPKQIDFQVSTLATLGVALRDWPSVLSVAFTASFLGAIYVLFTYLQPLLESSMGYGRDGVTAVLVVFGVGAVLGNLLGGWLNDRLGSTPTLMVLCLAQVVFMSLFSLLPLPGVWLFVLVLAWSVSGWSFLVPQQTRIVGQTPERQSVVLALNAAAIYIGAALGSAVGAQIIDAFGLIALGIAAGVGAILALAHLVTSEALFRRWRTVDV